jgi:hypothetical protein
VIKFFKGLELAEQVLLIVVVQVLPLNLLDCTSDPRLSVDGFVHLPVPSLAYLLPDLVHLRYVFLLHFNDCLGSVDLDPPQLFFKRLYILSALGHLLFSWTPVAVPLASSWRWCCMCV